MKAIITVEVPEHQIGQEVSVYFKDTMCVKSVCTPLTESDDCVSREDVLKGRTYTSTEEGWEGYTIDEDYVKSLPSVQPNREKGEWYIYQDYWYECSKCGCLRYMPTFTENYCPNCGADMKG
jgi:hypothetical protein